MRRSASYLLCLCALLSAGCSRGNGATDTGKAGTPAPTTSSSSPEILRGGHGTIGPVSYGFDDRHLTRTEIQLPIPPDYKDNVWAVKLIPAERADLLGEKICRYGHSEAVKMCNAVDEAGLALAMLERPIDDYRANFIEDGYTDDQLDTTQIGGREGFAVNVDFHEAPTEYSFVPVAGRTLMLARQAGPGLGRASEALGEVMSGLKVSK